MRVFIVAFVTLFALVGCNDMAWTENYNKALNTKPGDAKPAQPVVHADVAQPVPVLPVEASTLTQATNPAYATNIDKLTKLRKQMGEDLDAGKLQSATDSADLIATVARALPGQVQDLSPAVKSDVAMQSRALQELDRAITHGRGDASSMKGMLAQYDTAIAALATHQ